MHVRSLWLLCAASDEMRACIAAHKSIISAAQRHLPVVMRLMATEAVLVWFRWFCGALALRLIGCWCSLPQDADDERKEPIHGRIKFQWGSVLDNRARVRGGCGDCIVLGG